MSSHTLASCKLWPLLAAFRIGFTLPCRERRSRDERITAKGKKGSGAEHHGRDAHAPWFGENSNPALRVSEPTRQSSGKRHLN